MVSSTGEMTATVVSVLPFACSARWVALLTWKGVSVCRLLLLGSEILFSLKTGGLGNLEMVFVLQLNINLKSI